MTEKQRQLVNRAVADWHQIISRPVNTEWGRKVATTTNPLRDCGEWAVRYADRLLAILTKDES